MRQFLFLLGRALAECPVGESPRTYPNHKHTETLSSEKNENVQSELEKNWETFCEARELLEAKHFGRVVLHDGEIIAIYNDSGDAYSIGCEKYGLGNFSVELIGSRPISLGIFTMFVPTTVSVA